MKGVVDEIGIEGRVQIVGVVGVIADNERYFNLNGFRRDLRCKCATLWLFFLRRRSQRYLCGTTS